jgi:hypothetical protein
VQPLVKLWQLVMGVEAEGLAEVDSTVAEVEDLPVVASTVAGSVVAWRGELATAVAASALAGCAFPVVFPALRARAHVFLHLGIPRTCSLSQAGL